MSDMPGSNSLGNLDGLAKVTYPKPKGVGKPRGKYTKVKALMSHLKKGEPIPSGELK